uniref:Uncharacterized protein n=1 Tax=Anguilla anguilla TaxID=7936 RepID=A0A0E9TYX7_ANGAN
MGSGPPCVVAGTTLLLQETSLRALKRLRPPITVTDNGNQTLKCWRECQRIHSGRSHFLHF